MTGSPVELVHNLSAEIQIHDAVSHAESLRGRTAVYLVEEAASDERSANVKDFVPFLRRAA